jgi:hypothetical protein
LIRYKLPLYIGFQKPTHPAFYLQITLNYLLYFFPIQGLEEVAEAQFRLVVKHLTAELGECVTAGQGEAEPQFPIGPAAAG